jgi:hypothetical protein
VSDADFTRLAELPLLNRGNLTYVGAFRMPASATPDPTSDTYNFGYSGAGLGFNSSRSTLFVTGNLHRSFVAEIRPPSSFSFSSAADLPQATLIQDLRDAVDGKLNTIDPTPSNGVRVGGLLPYNGKLVVSAWSFYDADYNQSASHFVRSSIDLSVTGASSNAIRLSSTVSPRWLGGYMAPVPAEWQGALGGPAITGAAGMPIIAHSSVGPALASFDPDRAGSTEPAYLLGYPYDKQLAYQYSSNETSQNPVWNATSQVRGVVLPNGTRSVLFFGKHGLGSYCYGDGAACGDPADSSKGTHGYPYAYQIWAYDALDLAAVRAGSKQPHQLKPYAVWNFDLPFQDVAGTRDLGGATYDPSTRRIYISQLRTYLRGCCEPEPLIHVLQLN